MKAKIIDGKAIASVIRNEIKTELDGIVQTGGKPALAIMQIGEDKASATYANSIMGSAEKLDIDCIFERENSGQDDESLLQKMETLAKDSQIHGILLLRPVPNPKLEEELCLRIPLEKDIDCANPLSMGFLAMGSPRMLPPTPAAIVEILKRSKIETSGRRIAIIGRSNLVGKPLMLMLIRKHEGEATVTLCHTRTKNLTFILKTAEIVIAACGSPGLITGDMLSGETVVIDAGINWVDGKMVGDVDFASVSQIASFITPVPGGVGPVTRIMLFKNLIQAYRLQKRKKKA